MKKTLLTIFAGLTFLANAQTETTAKCYGWGDDLSDFDLPTPTVMVGYDQFVISAEDAINDVSKSQPWRFGYKYNTHLTPANSGQWLTVEGGKIWRGIITCPGALTVNLLLEDFYLPEGATFYLYDLNRTNKIGAYTSRNNRPEKELGTELIHGESIIVEYFEPTAVSGEGTFVISNVIHGYRGLNGVQKDLAEALHSSGDCNVDVNCELGEGWEQQIRSVAMIVVGGNGICSGALINNTCEDRRPLFLTADHCVGASTANWSFRFNWDSPEGTESCATEELSEDPGSPYDQTANGAVVLASASISDFALLEIDHLNVDDMEEWNVFFAGWDRSDDETVTEVTGIHHPRGDLKKICRENEDPYHDFAAGAEVWWIEDWDQGVTEPGSSGSPLFDQHHRIIGQLYGGAAACIGVVDNDAFDYYGRMGISWVNGASEHLAPEACNEDDIPEVFDGLEADDGICDFIEAIETEEELCYGDNSGSIEVITLGGISPHTYDIGDGPIDEGVFEDLPQGEYTIVVIDAIGCEEEVTVTLGGPSAIDLDYTSEYEVLGSDGSINITVTGGTPGYTYSWTGPDGFTSTEEDPSGLVSGFYTVEVRDENDCVLIEENIEVPSALSIAENSIGIRIYPNPTVGQFNIYNAEGHTMDITVYDISGRPVLSQFGLNAQINPIDLSEKANGTYLIEVNTSTGKITQRIVKK